MHMYIKGQINVFEETQVWASIMLASRKAVRLYKKSEMLWDHNFCLWTACILVSVATHMFHVQVDFLQLHNYNYNYYTW